MVSQSVAIIIILQFCGIFNLTFFSLIKGEENKDHAQNAGEMHYLFYSNIVRKDLL